MRVTINENDCGCGTCANLGNVDICSECAWDSKWQSKPLTNADRIRAMTDEELAYWMTHLHEDGHCLNERCQIFHDKTCEECVIDWLKQPAKEET